MPSKTNEIVSKSLWLTLLLTFCEKFVFFPPVMPHSGLDASWDYGLNQAVAQHLSFGTQLLFTCGPLGAVLTHAYHPATVTLMYAGSIVLGLPVIVAICLLSKKCGTGWRIPTMAIMLVILMNGDGYLVSVPFVLAGAALSLWTMNTGTATSGRSTPLTITMFSPLGVLPLVKGTFLLEAVAVCLICTLYLSFRRRFLDCLFCLVSPLVTMILFWELAGQHFADIRVYFSSVRYLTAGYSEAMSTAGSSLEVVIFLVAFIAIAISIVCATRLSSGTRAALLVLYSLAAFISFKAGFVREADNHVILSLSSIGAVLLTLVLLFKYVGHDHTPRYLHYVAAMLLLSLFIIGWQFRCIATFKSLDPAIVALKFAGTKEVVRKLRSDLGARAVVKSILTSQPIAISLWHFGHGSLEQQFSDANLMIRSANPISCNTQGSADVYSVAQSELLANGFRWNPRPIFQSYAAYVPESIRDNEQHLRGESAPDTLIFKVEPIDNRWPALEDGLSWPAILDNYSIVSDSGNYLCLARNPLPLRARSSFVLLGMRKARLGDNIEIPAVNEPVFVRIDLAPSWLGDIQATLFRLPELSILSTTESGKIERYRFVSTMAHSGFFVSPIVRDTEHFRELYRDYTGTGTRSPDYVKSFAIVSDGSSLSWEKSYTVTLLGYKH